MKVLVFTHLHIRSPLIHIVTIAEFKARQKKRIEAFNKNKSQDIVNTYVAS